MGQHAEQGELLELSKSINMDDARIRRAAEANKQIRKVNRIYGMSLLVKIAANRI